MTLVRASFGVFVTVGFPLVGFMAFCILAWPAMSWTLDDAKIYRAADQASSTSFFCGLSDNPICTEALLEHPNGQVLGNGNVTGHT